MDKLPRRHIKIIIPLKNINFTTCYSISHLLHLIVDPTKYFGCELGAQTQFDLKNERYIVNGSHDAAKLQDILDGFIKRFVLCQECDNPETRLVSNNSYVPLCQQHLIIMRYNYQVLLDDGNIIIIPQGNFKFSHIVNVIQNSTIIVLVK